MSSAEITCTASPEQIKVINLKRYSKAMCNKHVHSIMTRSSRFRCPVGFINKPTTFEFWIPRYTDDLLWRDFLSPQCRNCSGDPDHAHLRNTVTHHKTKTSRGRLAYKIILKSLALAVAEKLHGV